MSIGTLSTNTNGAPLVSSLMEVAPRTFILTVVPGLPVFRLICKPGMEPSKA